MPEEEKYPEWMGKMRKLYPEEIKEFLDGPVVARVATIDSKGDPYVTPVWQEWDGEFLWVIPREKTVFAKHLQNNPRVSVSCAEDGGTYTRVLFRGYAEIEGPMLLEGKSLAIGQRMATRYLGPRGPEYLEPTLDRPRYLVKIVPEKIISWDGVEWHPKYVTHDS